MGRTGADLVMTGGRRGTAPALAIRRASGGRTFAVHISDPRMPATKFDLLVVSAHDPPRGENVVVVTPTASGKTLCYNLPVLQRLIDNPESRALYLFPTKALAHDQYAGPSAPTRELEHPATG